MEGSFGNMKKHLNGTQAQEQVYLMMVRKLL